MRAFARSSSALPMPRSVRSGCTYRCSRRFPFDIATNPAIEPSTSATSTSSFGSTVFVMKSTVSSSVWSFGRNVSVPNEAMKTSATAPASLGSAARICASLIAARDDSGRARTRHGRGRGLARREQPHVEQVVELLPGLLLGERDELLGRPRAERVRLDPRPQGREERRVAYLVPQRLQRHRSEEHTSELQSLRHLVCRLL